MTRARSASAAEGRATTGGGGSSRTTYPASYARRLESTNASEFLSQSRVLMIATRPPSWRGCQYQGTDHGAGPHDDRDEKDEGHDVWAVESDIHLGDDRARQADERLH
jgi:hypothetical protein